MGDLRCATWPKLDHAIRELITEELAALALELQSIKGIHTESSYKTKFDELFSQSVRETRAATLKEAAARVVENLSGMRNSVTVTRSQVTVGPILTEFGNLGVRIDVSICKRGSKNSVSKGTFTGEQEYSSGRQAIETTERNRDDVDQRMGSNDDHSNAFSTRTGSTNASGSDLFSQRTDQSYSGKSIDFSGNSIGVSGDDNVASAHNIERESVTTSR